MVKQEVKEKVFLNYTQEELDWQYDHSKRFEDTSIFSEARNAESARVREKIKGIRDVSYGPSADELLDIFPAEWDKSPVAVYIHGGAWQRGHKDNGSFPAESFVPRGVAWVPTNFIMVPAGSLDDMVRQNRDALAWVYNNIADYGGDPEQIFVMGHSSGGHLTGMMLCTDWEGDYGLPADLLKGAVAISGMYDLQAVFLSYRNGFLKLDEEGCRRNSSIHNIRDYGPKLIIGCSEHDTDEFHRQPLEFIEAWRDRGHQCEWIELMGRNHFTGNNMYNEPDGPLLDAVFRMMGV
jgi:arylformamidase